MAKQLCRAVNCTVDAFVLIRVKPNHDREVLQRIKKLEVVKDATTVYGEYDLVAKINVQSLDDLDTFIFDVVRPISGVMGTTTLITTSVKK